MIPHLIAEMTLTLRILFRQPGFWIPTVLFPGMLYAFFGASSGGGQWATHAMASFMIYAVLGVGFFQFGVSVAQDRESPFATWQSSLPGHVWLHWVARILASLVFCAVAVSVVAVIALVLAPISMTAHTWLRLGSVCLICVVPATLMGIALGSLASARAAVPMANLIYLPLAYLGGLWVPPNAMPDAVNAVSKWTPTRAMGELSWSAIGTGSWDMGYVTMLSVWTAISAAIIAYAQMRQSRQA